MKILHVFRNPPDERVRELVKLISQDKETTEFHLYQKPLDYGRLVELILEHDQIISWW